MARELDALVRIYAQPTCLVSNTEFTSRTILKWADQKDVVWHNTDPGKPQQNAVIESFNGSLRDGDRIRSPKRGDLRHPG